LRTWLARSVSPSMKYSFGAGIGLFLLLIGMYETGLVTSSVTGMNPARLETKAGLLVPPATPLKLGNLHDTRVLLAAGGFLLIAAFMYWNLRGGILLGIILTAA